MTRNVTAPRSRTRGVALVGLCAIAALELGCDRSASRDVAAETPTSTSVSPVDHLRPGEVVEGPERAFDFPVPRGMRVRTRFPDVVYAEGRVPFEHLTNYVRERVEGGRVETGPVKTVFERAVLKHKPEQIVRIEVTAHAHKVELKVQNQNPPPVEPGLSEPERWRKAGVAPDGQPLPEQNE